MMSVKNIRFIHPFPQQSQSPPPSGRTTRTPAYRYKYPSPQSAAGAASFHGGLQFSFLWKERMG